ncbi:AzlC family ABC transporter permease [Candidatus Pelagibacter sp. HIMB1321]|jgi:predicted branched-subunit amino acid permease|uniref:AzlC family ABC transporter permease n=1 Tax=Candidatus Pelagibacter sp. HIMB1321 TaxID=1388755 RepID=UPI000A07E4C5|nr:AzlC family ABC transporter permease [Candidatus Pelagibacter sp. HIMB1321]SMF73226.1 Predicted branched-chain amino acid permease (azaleucine resistance) [Candidatus Pelagibacter sp. HIMB1321]
MKKSKLFVKGIIDVLPLLIPVVPFGIILGAIGIELGFSVLETFATSLIIFGGASQIVFLQLFSGGASSIITITSTFVVNSRHLLYGASLSEYLNKLSIGWKIILSYLLTDQAYAVSNIFFEKNKDNDLKHYYLLGSGFILWFVWQIFTFVGIFLGSIVPEELGLAYTIPLTFISLLVGYFRKLDHLIVILISGILSITLYDVPLKSYIILSSFLSLIVAFAIIHLKGNSK